MGKETANTAVSVTSAPSGVRMTGMEVLKVEAKARAVRRERPIKDSGASVEMARASSEGLTVLSR